MDAFQLNEILGSIPIRQDFNAESKSIVSQIERDGDNPSLIPVLLEFMETNSSLDFGSPGAFVKYIEKFGPSVYSGMLLESLARHPTTHTVWMLRRLINLTSDSRDYDELIGVMIAISQQESCASAQDLAEMFLEDLI